MSDRPHDELEYDDVVDAIEAMRHRETDDSHIATVSYMWTLIQQYRTALAKASAT